MPGKFSTLGFSPTEKAYSYDLHGWLPRFKGESRSWARVTVWLASEDYHHELRDDAMRALRLHNVREVIESVQPTHEDFETAFRIIARFVEDPFLGEFLTQVHRDVAYTWMGAIEEQLEEMAA